MPTPPIRRAFAVLLAGCLAVILGLSGCTPPAAVEPVSEPEIEQEQAAQSVHHHRGHGHHHEGQSEPGSSDRGEGDRESGRPHVSPDHEKSQTSAAGVPAKVAKVLRYIEEHHRAPEGYVGGREFHNAGRDGEQALPRTDANARRITYQEWDVNPKVSGVNRGAERLVTGSDGSAYYTSDHYRTFKKVK